MGNLYPMSVEGVDKHRLVVVGWPTYTWALIGVCNHRCVGWLGELPPMMERIYITCVGASFDI